MPQINKWSNDQVNFLIENYKRMSVIGISAIIGKSPKAVERKAESLRLKKNVRWTDNEILLLTQNLDMPLKKLTSLLTGHPPSSIKDKIIELRNRK